MIAEFEILPTSMICDAMNRMNSMKADMKPIGDVRTVAGSAVTVQCFVGDNLIIHKAIYVAQAGDILVIDAKGHKNTAVWGAIMTRACMQRGIKAVVIDGSTRDLDENRGIRFPLFCLGVVPAGPQKSWGGNINVPIQCSGVKVSPGDIVVGDNDGVVVVPREMARDVLEKAKEKVSMEKEWIAGIESGKSTLEIIGLHEKLNELELEIS